MQKSYILSQKHIIKIKIVQSHGRERLIHAQLHIHKSCAKKTLNAAGNLHYLKKNMRGVHNPNFFNLVFCLWSTTQYYLILKNLNMLI
jgi:hypothetical protein